MKKVINTLANGEMLEARYRDHALCGSYGSYRECHIQSDWFSYISLTESSCFCFLLEQERIATCFNTHKKHTHIGSN